MKVILDIHNTNNNRQGISFKGKLPPKAITNIIPDEIFEYMYSACYGVIPKIERTASMRETERFIRFRDKFSVNLEKVNLKTEKAAWDFYTNSCPETQTAYESAQDEFAKLFQDRAAYETFLGVDKDKLPKHEQKQLKDLLKSFDDYLNTGDALKALEKRENEIAQKYNSYVPKINGKEVTKTEITRIIQTEADTDIRKHAYEARIKGGDLIAQDLAEFVKMRNEYAKTKGYDNYFDYKLKEDYEVEPEFLDSLISEVHSGAKAKISAIQEENYTGLKKFFNTENLQGYHYGYLLPSNPEKAVNEILETQNIEQISKQIYKGMGYDVDELIANGNLTLDLYPRKGKNTHGFCFGIEAGKDSRILANLSNNVISLDTLNHEMGHCIYDLGISRQLPVVDRCPSSSAFTEAIAMMMGDIMKKENVLNDILPKNLLKSFMASHSKDEADFVSKSLLIIDFEREFYKNPSQNPAQLWRNLRIKHKNQHHAADNEWATIPHYLSHPAYYQNYFRATIMKAQIYNYLRKTLGEITKNTQTAEFLNKNIFSLGQSVEEYDLIKQLTGKKFSASDFIETL